ncbi:MAG: helix-turn-helix transcriptional regulator [Anaerolineales bacterium]|nr:helix-turn-helix transcriptional regulator [Anaerolineales bacterium]
MPSEKFNERQLLENWEEVYKKGFLTFWLLLFLHERPAYAYEAGPEVERLSRGSLSVDENSVYRALNRFETIGLVSSELRDSDIGPKRRYYRLTRTGAGLLAAFIRRNILLFEDPALRDRLQAVLRNDPSSKENPP